MTMTMLEGLPGMQFALVGPRAAGALAEAKAEEREVTTRIKRATPRLFAEAMLDEFVTAVFARGSRNHMREQLVQANEDADILYNQIRLGLLPADPAEFHLTPPAPDPAEVTVGRASSWRTTAEHISFPSAYEVHETAAVHWNAWEANLDAHAFVLRSDLPDRPWLINIHGHRQGTMNDLMLFRSEGFAQRHDLNVMHPVLPHHGVRRDDSSPEPPPGIDFSMNVFGIAQAVWDVRRCIGWIRSQSDAPIVVHGVSLGAYVGSLLAGLDDRVDGIVAGVPVIDFPAIILEHAVRMTSDQDDIALMAGDTVRAIHRLISPLGLETKVPFDRRFIYAGVVDRVSAPGQALTLWRHWGCPRIEWYEGGHVGHMWDSSVWDLVDEAIETTIS